MIYKIANSAAFSALSLVDFSIKTRGIEKTLEEIREAISASGNTSERFDTEQGEGSSEKAYLGMLQAVSAVAKWHRGHNAADCPDCGG